MIAHLRLAGRVLVFVVGVSIASGAAYAPSGNAQAGPDSGLKIPGVTHGQMAVIDQFDGQITTWLRGSSPVMRTFAAF